MPISESMVQDIVQEVMAKMQIADAPTGKHGVFKEMNDAIEAAKKAELIREKKSSPASVKKSKKMQKLWLVWVLMRQEWVT